MQKGGWCLTDTCREKERLQKILKECNKYKIFSPECIAAGRKVRKLNDNKTQKGGSSISYSSIDSSLTGNNARILGTNSFLASDKNCGDGYNHYTGGNQKTMY